MDRVEVQTGGGTGAGEFSQPGGSQIRDLVDWQLSWEDSTTVFSRFSVLLSQLSLIPGKMPSIGLELAGALSGPLKPFHYCSGNFMKDGDIKKHSASKERVQ